MEIYYALHIAQICGDPYYTLKAMQTAIESTKLQELFGVDLFISYIEWLLNETHVTEINT